MDGPRGAPADAAPGRRFGRLRVFAVGHVALPGWG